MKKNLEEKCAEMKAKNLGVPTEFVKWQFKPGVRLPNAGRKKKASVADEALSSIAGQPCPDELLVGVLEGLRNQGVSMVEALQYKIFCNAIIGQKDSVRYGIEILNRLYGKVALVLTKDKDDGAVSKMTPEEIREETLALLQRLEDFTAPKKKRTRKKKGEAPVEIVSEPEA